MLLSAYAKLRAGNCTRTVVIDSTDTYVYVQAAYVSHSLRGDLMIKRKHALVNCRAMLPDEIASIIIPLHVISGSDHTSAFCGHGKKKLLAKVAKDLQARELLEQVGESLELDDNVRDQMKKFVLTYIYGGSGDVTCGQARASKWNKLKSKSLVRLPPDADSLNHHIERTNYISYCQLNYNMCNEFCAISLL